MSPPRSTEGGTRSSRRIRLRAVPGRGGRHHAPTSSPRWGDPMWRNELDANYTPPRADHAGRHLLRPAPCRQPARNRRAIAAFTTSGLVPCASHCGRRCRPSSRSPCCSRPPAAWPWHGVFIEPFEHPGHQRMVSHATGAAVAHRLAAAGDTVLIIAGIALRRSQQHQPAACGARAAGRLIAEPRTDQPPAAPTWARPGGRRPPDASDRRAQWHSRDGFGPPKAASRCRSS